MFRAVLFGLYDLILLSCLVAWTWATGMYRSFLHLVSQQNQNGVTGVVDFLAFPIGLGLLCMLAGVGLALRNSNDSKFVAYMFFLVSAALTLLWFFATLEATAPVEPD